MAEGKPTFEIRPTSKVFVIRPSAITDLTDRIPPRMLEQWLVNRVSNIDALFSCNQHSHELAFAYLARCEFGSHAVCSTIHIRLFQSASIR
jgi:hypothetical protein